MCQCNLEGDFFFFAIFYHVDISITNFEVRIYLTFFPLAYTCQLGRSIFKVWQTAKNFILSKINPNPYSEQMWTKNGTKMVILLKMLYLPHIFWWKYVSLYYYNDFIKRELEGFLKHISKESQIFANHNWQAI